MLRQCIFKWLTTSDQVIDADVNLLKVEIIHQTDYKGYIGTCVFKIIINAQQQNIIKEIGSDGQLTVHNHVFTGKFIGKNIIHLNTVLCYELEFVCIDNEYHKKIAIIRKEKAFDPRLKLEQYQYLIDNEIAFNRYNKQIYNANNKQINVFFPNTWQRKTHTLGVKQMILNINTHWTQIINGCADAGQFLQKDMQTKPLPATNIQELQKNLPKEGDTYGKFTVLKVNVKELENIYQLNANKEFIPIGTKMNVSMLVTWESKIQRIEHMQIIFHSCIEDENHEAQIIEKQISLNIDEILMPAEMWAVEKIYEKNQYIRYYNKIYKCLKEHVSNQQDWNIINRMHYWQECTKEYTKYSNESVSNNFVSVWCSEYGQELLNQSLNFLQLYVRTKNNNIITTMDLPFDEMIKLHYHDEIEIIDEQKEYNGYQGKIKKWYVNIDDKNSVCNIECVTTMPIIKQERQIIKPIDNILPEYNTNFLHNEMFYEEYRHTQYPTEINDQTKKLQTNLPIVSKTITLDDNVKYQLHLKERNLSMENNIQINVYDHVKEIMPK